jgi:polysaccharide deacetylase family protein (PEP-CTERM system associated)
LTFDVEDWFQLVGRRAGCVPADEQRVRIRSQVERILVQLQRHGAKATFFVLGITAERFPDVVEAILRGGHEVASHGYAHRVVKGMDRGEFARDVQASVEILKRITGQHPRGYRAPEFSIVNETLWALDVLLEAGFVYDSSIFPFQGPRYGIPSANVVPGPLATPDHREILEVPLSVYVARNRRIPIAGGGYWRAMPERVIRPVIRAVAEERPPVLYFHPAEFDERWLWPSRTTLPVALRILKENVGRAAIPAKVEAILSEHVCVGVSEYLRANATGQLAAS